MKKRIFSILLSVFMIAAMFPTASFAADSSAAGNSNNVLVAKATAAGSGSVKLSWIKTDGAIKYVVYGNKYSKGMKSLVTLKASRSSYKVRKIGGKKLSKHSIYRFKVVAYRANGTSVNSKLCTVITSNTKGKYANPVKLQYKHSELTLGQGETSAKPLAELCGISSKIYKSKKHPAKKYGRKYTYVSVNPAVASADESGIVKVNANAVEGSTAVFYVQELNGLYKRINVTVGQTSQIKLSFNKNASDATGTMPVQIFERNIKKQINKNAFARAGYTFKGWNTMPDGTGKNYADGENTYIDYNMTLFAQWQPVKSDAERLMDSKSDAKAELKAAALGLTGNAEIQAVISEESSKIDSLKTFTDVEKQRKSSLILVNNAVSEFKTDNSSLGGRVFYVDEKAKGGKFRFYKKNGEELPYNDSMSAKDALRLLSKDAYWAKEIEKTSNSKDKFYIYATDNGEYDGAAVTEEWLSWGSCDYETGVCIDVIGSGKANSEKLLNMPTSYVSPGRDKQSRAFTAWSWLNNLRKDNLNNKKDWFIPSCAEVEKLYSFMRSENLVNSYVGNVDYIITSTENKNSPFYVINHALETLPVLIPEEIAVLVPEDLDCSYPSGWAKVFNVNTQQTEVQMKAEYNMRGFAVRSIGGDSDVIAKEVDKLYRDYEFWEIYMPLYSIFSDYYKKHGIQGNPDAIIEEMLGHFNFL